MFLISITKIYCTFNQISLLEEYAFDHTIKNLSELSILRLLNLLGEKDWVIFFYVSSKVRIYLYRIISNKEHSIFSHSCCFECLGFLFKGRIFYNWIFEQKRMVESSYDYSKCCSSSMFCGSFYKLFFAEKKYVNIALESKKEVYSLIYWWKYLQF